MNPVSTKAAGSRVLACARLGAAPLACALFAACGAPETPGPAPPKPSAPVASVAPSVSSTAAVPAPSEYDECPTDPDSAPAAGYGAGGPWVGLFARPYNPEPGPTEGERWSFSDRGLPAISKDGTRVLSYTEEPRIFGGSSEERLQITRVADEKVISQTPLRLQGEAAVRKVAEAGEDPKKLAAAWDALARETGKAIEALNAKITAEGWTSLVPCWIDIAPGEATPACSMKDQEIRCGDALSARYEEPRLDITVRGKKLRIQRAAWLHKPVGGTKTVPDPRSPGDLKTVPDDTTGTPVRGCFDEVFYHPDRAALVAHLHYACQDAGGDACFAAGVWHTIPLPVAPGANAPRPAPANDCPSGMDALPAGSVTIGPPEGARERRRPNGPVQVAPVCLDTREVTVAEYTACVKTGACPSADPLRWSPALAADPEALAEARAGCNWGVAGREQHPMNCLSWGFANAYCGWANKRLPTEREWQWAAEGPGPRKYPFSEDATIQGAAPFKTPAGEPALRVDGVCFGLEQTCGAGKSARDKGPFGALDLTGNVSEWTSSTSRENDGCWSASGWVVRGASYGDRLTEQLSAARRRYELGRSPQVGFRCAKDRTP